MQKSGVGVVDGAIRLYKKFSWWAEMSTHRTLILILLAANVPIGSDASCGAELEHAPAWCPHWIWNVLRLGLALRFEA